MGYKVKKSKGKEKKKKKSVEKSTKLGKVALGLFWDQEHAQKQGKERASSRKKRKGGRERRRRRNEGTHYGCLVKPIQLRIETLIKGTCLSFLQSE